MAFQSTVTETLDRLYAINQTFKTLYGINASRYFPSSISSHVPLITAVPGNGRHDATAYGAENVRSIRSYVQILWVRNFLSGAIGETAQREAEALIDCVLYEYWRRPRLELAETNGAGVTVYKPLPDIMEDALMGQDSGIIAENNDIATVRFTLTVETNRTIRRL